MRSAPVMGEHTREICRDLLDLNDSEISDLVDAGVLEVHQSRRLEGKADVRGH